MMNEPEQPPTSIRLREILIPCGFLLVLILLIIPELLYYFCFGWIYYLARTVGTLQFDFPSMLGLLLAAAAFFGLFDALIRSFHSQVASSNPWRFHNSMMILPALFFSFTAGLAFIGTAHQISWMAREPDIFENAHNGEIRSQSRNNLKLIVLAAHEYHEKWDHFPAGGTLLAHSIPGHSWQTSLLPYIDQGDLFQAIDLIHPWLDEKNKANFSTTVSPYLNPLLKGASGHDVHGYALTHYAGNAHLLGLGKAIGFKQIIDGDSNTLFAGEVPADFKPWGDPTNSRDPGLGLKTSRTGFGNPVRDDSTLFSFADGSVRALNNKIDPKVLKALATPDGGEQVGEY